MAAVKSDRSGFLIGLAMNLASLRSLSLDRRGISYLAVLSTIYAVGLTMVWRHPRAHLLQRQLWATIQVRKVAREEGGAIDGVEESSDHHLSLPGPCHRCCSTS